MSFMLALSITSCTDNYTFDGGEITTKPVDELIYETVPINETEALTGTAEEDDIDGSVIIDRTGNFVRVPDEINTIVSAAPSVTEILTGLGISDKIIAADTWSYDVEGIDPAICTIDFYTLNIEALAALNPDLIIVTEMSTAGAEDPYEQLKTAGAEVIYVPTSQSIEEIKKDIMFIAEYTKTTESGKTLVSEIESTVNEITEKALVLSYSPSVYFEMEAAPNLYSCGSGTFINEAISLCGGRNIYAGESGWLANSEESVIAANPDVIITSVMYDGYDYNEIKTRSGWENISAVQNSRVVQVDANSVSRPSHNIVKGLKQIANAVRPGVFPDYAQE